MARVEERIHIDAAVSDVWGVLTDWESQPEWMQDAKAVRVVSDNRTGEGVTIECPTNIALGIVVLDVMEVTEWQHERLIAVRHTGRVIRGHGAFELAPTHLSGDRTGTIFTWWEEIDAPLGRFGDAIADLFVVPIVSMIFRRSLRSLKTYAEERIAAEQM